MFDDDHQQHRGRHLKKGSNIKCDEDNEIKWVQTVELRDSFLRDKAYCAKTQLFDGEYIYPTYDWACPTQTGNTLLVERAECIQKSQVTGDLTAYVCIFDHSRRDKDDLILADEVESIKLEFGDFKFHWEYNIFHPDSTAGIGSKSKKSTKQRTDLPSDCYAIEYGKVCLSLAFSPPYDTAPVIGCYRKS